MILERMQVTKQVKKMVNDHSGRLAEIKFAPEGADLNVGYYVIHSIPGGLYFDSENLVAPDESVILRYQIDGVSGRHEGAEWLGDRIRHVFLARTSSGAFQVPFEPPAGWKCIDRQPDDSGPGAPDVEGVRPNAVFTVAERFALALTPA